MNDDAPARPPTPGPTPELSADPTITAAPTADPAPGHLRLLIVDDSPEDAETYQRYLGNWAGQPVECRQVSLGEEGLALARAWQPDCLLLDYRLPDMTGLEFLAAPRPPGAVVMLTGLGDEQVAVAALRAGAQDYLVKGRLSAERLQHAVQQATALHRLESALADSRRRMAAVLASITDSFVTLDQEFRFRSVNRAAELLSGQVEAALLGRTLWDVFPWMRAHADAATYRDATQAGRAFSFEPYVPELDAWFDVRVYPAPGGQQAIYLRDVSARKRQELQLKRAAQHMQDLYLAGAALNAVQRPDEVTATILAEAGRVLNAGWAALLRLTPGSQELVLTGYHGYDAALMQAWTRLPLAAPLPAGDAARSGQPVLLASLEEASVWYPRLFDGEAAAGRHAWAALPLLQGEQLLGVLALAFDRPGTPAGDQSLLLAFAELCAQALGRADAHGAELALRATLERRVEERTAELTRSNRDLEQFAYVASHDLKEPLRTISSYAQLLDQRYAGALDERASRYLGFVVGGAQRMHRLIEDLLSFSRIGQRPEPATRCDLNLILRGALADLTAATQEAGAEIRVGLAGPGGQLLPPGPVSPGGEAAPLPGPLPTLMVDATQFTQLFSNLIGNALKFRRAGVTPVITVTARPTEQYWRFEVSDNGIGLDPQHAEQIFTLFSRLHRRDEYPGSGIGLAVCRRILERHGGELWAESVPGQGSTFCFTLPRPAPEPGDR